MELVEGRTLADRIAGGTMPVDEALAVARQVAEALEAAHDQGIVHRDLKPANIKLRPDGLVKVLDFGLATAAGSTLLPSSLSQSPTVTSPALTRTGTILGTTAYMSPEQVKGQPADRRSDVWAFGCVLYEMLAGRPAFDGETDADVIGAILKTDPDWRPLPGLAPSVRRLLRRCLEKDRRRRLHDIGDARIELEDAEAEPGAGPVAGFRRLGWTIAAAGIAAAAALIVSIVAGPTAPRPERRVEISTPPTADLHSFAVAPDGSRLVFAATWDGQPHLWLREMDTLRAQPIAGSAGAQYPCWSPGGQRIAFLADAKLKHLSVSGGSAHVLADTTTGECTWNESGDIVYAVGSGLPLRRVGSDGGPSLAVTSIDPAEMVQHLRPSFLPDGRQFFLQVSGPRMVRGAYIGSLASPAIRRLFDVDAGSVVFAPPDHVLYVQQRTLFARHFDTRSLEAGDPFPIARDVGPQVSVSFDGSVIAYRTIADDVASRELMWVDRSGMPLTRVDAFSNHPELSSDGRYVATWGRIGGIWILDTARRAPRRLNDYNGQPIWSPDGSQVAFNCSITRLCVQRIDGLSRERTLWTAPESVRAILALDWSPDGRFLLFKQYVSDETGWDLHALRLTADGRTDGDPIGLVASRHDERDAQFSPDGRLIAYQSNETGRFEIWVRSFPALGQPVRVSESGGTQVRWPRQGQELFYLAPNGTLMAAPVLSAPTDPLEIGPAVALFPTNLLIYPAAGDFRQDYDVSHDGGRILMNVTVRDAVAPPITLILNWNGRALDPPDR